MLLLTACQSASGPQPLPETAAPAALQAGSLYDDLVRQWPYVGSYLLKDGRLFLILRTDGGSIEFEPSP
jgi:hypothetical protein